MKYYNPENLIKINQVLKSVLPTPLIQIIIEYDTFTFIKFKYWKNENLNKKNFQIAYPQFSFDTFNMLVKNFENSFPSSITPKLGILQEKFQLCIEAYFKQRIIFQEFFFLCMQNEAYTFLPLDMLIPNPDVTKHILNDSNQLFIKYESQGIQEQKSMEAQVNALLEQYDTILQIAYPSCTEMYMSGQNIRDNAFFFYSFLKITKQISEKPTEPYTLIGPWSSFINEYPTALEALQGLCGKSAMLSVLSSDADNLLFLTAKELLYFKLAVSKFSEATGNYVLFTTSTFKLARFLDATQGTSLDQLQLSLNEKIQREFNIENAIAFIFSMKPVVSGQVIIGLEKSLSIGSLEMPELKSQKQKSISQSVFSPDKFKEALQVNLNFQKEKSLEPFMEELNLQLRKITAQFKLSDAILMLDAIYEHLFLTPTKIQAVNQALIKIENLRMECAFSQRPISQTQILSKSISIFYVPTLRDHINYIIKLLEPFSKKKIHWEDISDGIEIDIDGSEITSGIKIGVDAISGKPGLMSESKTIMIVLSDMPRDPLWVYYKGPEDLKLNRLDISKPDQAELINQIIIGFSQIIKCHLTVPITNYLHKFEECGYSFIK